MARKDFPLIAISVQYDNPKKKTGVRGWSIVSRDKSGILVRDQMVKLEGTAGLYPAYVVRWDEKRNLIVVKHEGYTSYISRGSGNAYSPARFVVYEYAEVGRGNEIELHVDLFGIMELPLKWYPGWHW